jgi:phage baseplate assembly protein W
MMDGFGNELNIRPALFLLLRTARGECPVLPDYGCDLYKFVFREPTAEVLSLISAAVEAAVRRWEPRIELSDVSTIAHPDLSGADITISYTFGGVGTASNFVFAFCFVDPKAA